MTAAIAAARGVLTGTGGRLARAQETFDFYVDSELGDDGNPGTRALPWQTLAKVNAAALVPGQRVGLKRGGRWTQTLIPANGGIDGSPVVFGAYGIGPRPLIDGSTTVDGWVPYVSDAPQEMLVNPGFDIWSNAANPPENWARFDPAGSSTERVPSITGNGVYALRLNGDASNSNISISQNITLTADTAYTLSFAGRVSIAGRSAGVVISIPSGTYAGYQLQPDGTWSTVTSTSIAVTSTSLTEVELPFTMLPETALVNFSIKRTNLTSAYAEFDAVSLVVTPAAPPPNTYEVPLATRPWTVSRDDQPLAEGNSPVTLLDGEWFWQDATLYVRDDTQNPGAATWQVSGGMERAVSVVGKPHVRVRDIEARHTTGRAFRADDGADATVFQRVRVSHAGRSDQTGSYGGTISVRHSDDCRVLDSEVWGANNDGIHAWDPRRVKILRNRVYRCNGPQSDGIDVQAPYYYDASAGYDVDSEVAHNWVDQRGTNSPKGTIILIHDGARAHHNVCYGGNFQVAMYGSRARVDHNVLIDNALGEAWGGAVQMVDHTTTTDVEIDHNLIINPKVGIRTGDSGDSGQTKTGVNEHHNTIVLTTDSLGGIWHESGSDGETVDNIVYGPSSGAVIHSSDVIGAWVSDRNVLGPERVGVLRSGASLYDTLAAWRTATSQDAASVAIDPTLDDDYAPTAGLLTAGHLA